MKKLLCLLLTIVCCLCMVACDNCPSCEKKGGYEHPEYQSEYTEEEHIERISARTREKYAEEIEEGIIIDFKVEILYAFYDNDPEYFLVELEYSLPLHGAYTNHYTTSDGEKGDTRYTTKYKHIIGYIENDSYMTGIIYYADFMYGRSAYTVFGYNDSKKYYGGTVQAVEKDGKIVQIFDTQCLSVGVIEFHSQKPAEGMCKCPMNEVVPESKYKYLMEANFKLFPKIY